MGAAALNYTVESRFDRNAVHDFLHGAPYWKTSKEIHAAINITPTRMRELCQLYPTWFVSSGEGYKATTTASRDEIRACVQDLLSRAEKITHRASALAGQL